MGQALSEWQIYNLGLCTEILHENERVRLHSMEKQNQVLDD